MIFISMLGALAALLPAGSGAALTPDFVHDVKVFHKVAGERSRPLPARISVLVGGVGVGKMIRGPRGGKRFIVAGVKGGEIALTRFTGRKARITLRVASICRANPTARYYLRASVVVNGKPRTAFSQGDCRWVVQVLERDSRAVTRTTFTFEG